MRMTLCYRVRRVILDHPDDKLAVLGVRFGTSLQNWIVSNPNLALASEEWSEVNRFSHLVICISSDGRLTDGVASYIQKAWLAFANLKHP